MGPRSKNRRSGTSVVAHDLAWPTRNHSPPDTRTYKRWSASSLATAADVSAVAVTVAVPNDANSGFVIERPPPPFSSSLHQNVGGSVSRWTTKRSRVHIPRSVHGAAWVTAWVTPSVAADGGMEGRCRTNVAVVDRKSDDWYSPRHRGHVGRDHTSSRRKAHAPQSRWAHVRATRWWDGNSRKQTGHSWEGRGIEGGYCAHYRVRGWLVRDVLLDGIQPRPNRQDRVGPGANRGCTILTKGP